MKRTAALHGTSGNHRRTYMRIEPEISGVSIVLLGDSTRRLLQDNFERSRERSAGIIDHIMSLATPQES